jgi:hypothetical protein
MSSILFSTTVKIAAGTAALGVVSAPVAQFAYAVADDQASRPVGNVESSQGGVGGKKTLKKPVTVQPEPAPVYEAPVYTPPPAPPAPPPRVVAPAPTPAPAPAPVVVAKKGGSGWLLAALGAAAVAGGIVLLSDDDPSSP